MKKFLTLVLTAFIFLNLSYSQSFNSAVDYLNYINVRLDKINHSLWNYLRVSAHSKREKKQVRQKVQLTKTIEEARNEIAAMPPFDGDTKLRDSIVAYLDFAAAMSKGDLAKLEQLEALSNNSYEDMMRYMRKEAEIKQKYQSRFDAAQKVLKEFANEHNINLVKSTDKLSQKIAKANEVIEYSNDLYLIYFKPSITLTYIFKAIGDDDTTKLFALTDSLLRDIATGKTLLAKIKPFEGDNSLVQATNNVLETYRKIVFDDLPKVENFYRVKQEYEQFSKYLHSKTKDQWTQQDIDKYNQLVDKYNAAAAQVNQTINQMQKLTVQTQKQFNQVYNSFVSRHTPH